MREIRAQASVVTQMEFVVLPRHKKPAEASSWSDLHLSQLLGPLCARTYVQRERKLGQTPPHITMEIAPLLWGENGGFWGVLARPWPRSKSRTPVYRRPPPTHTHTQRNLRLWAAFISQLFVKCSSNPPGKNQVRRLWCAQRDWFYRRGCAAITPLSPPRL